MLRRSAGQPELAGVAPDCSRFDQHAFARDDTLAIEANRVEAQGNALECLFDILQRRPTNLDGSEGRDVFDFPSRRREGRRSVHVGRMPGAAFVQTGAFAKRPALHDVQTFDKGLQIFGLHVVHAAGTG